MTVTDPWRIIAAALHGELVDKDHEPDNPAARAYNLLRNGHTDQALDVIRATGIRYIGLDTAPSGTVTHCASSEAAHTLRIVVSDDADTTFTIDCPHDHTSPQACTAWEINDTGCICDCQGCTAGEHDDCDQESIDEIGQMWCKATPTGGCWYIAALNEVGASDIFKIVGQLTAEWSVTLTGTSWDTPTAVRQATEPVLNLADEIASLNSARTRFADDLRRRGQQIIAGIVAAAHPNATNVTVGRDNNGLININCSPAGDRAFDRISIDRTIGDAAAHIVRTAVDAILPAPSPTNLGGCGKHTFKIADHHGDPAGFAGIWNEVHRD